MLLERMKSAMHGAIQGWRMAGPVPVELTKAQRRYIEGWAIYTGELFEQFTRDNPYRDDPAIYQNTKLLWKHAESVVDFYASVVYQGALPTTAKPLPDGAPSAIPIDPQTGNDERNTLLVTASTELFSAWNWQQQMSLRPMYAAALGDCLTELIDDLERRFVYPLTIWPGYVKEIELDYVGNVRRYVLEYQVTEKRADGSSETYLYRKEVDGEAFRYFRDDKPHDYGDGAVVPNPYGFVPAVWDRHRIGAPGHVRGRSALHGTRQSLLQLNSIFSHAFDHQRKVFFAPIMVASSAAGAGGGEMDLTTPNGQDYVETFDVVPMPKDATLLQPQFDIGKTREMLKDLQEGILDENPEARFYQQMREMQMVTAPGAERLMGDVKNRVDLVRAGEDAGTVKILQMAIAIAGMRANGEEWKRTRDGQRVPLNRRQRQFLRFDLESFSRGELDMSIQPRPIVFPTEQERIEVLEMKEGLQTKTALIEAWGETKGTEIYEERRRELGVVADANPGGLE